MDQARTRRNPAAAFGGGAVIGALGGLIGLGGAEFRLPLLIGMFRFAALEAIILNKTMSLVVVTHRALPPGGGALRHDRALMAGDRQSAGRQPVGRVAGCRMGNPAEVGRPCIASSPDCWWSSPWCSCRP